MAGSRVYTGGWIHYQEWYICIWCCGLGVIHTGYENALRRSKQWRSDTKKSDGQIGMGVCGGYTGMSERDIGKF